MGYYRKKSARQMAVIAAALAICLSPAAAVWADQPDVRQTTGQIIRQPAKQTPAPAVRQTIEVRKYIFTGQDVIAGEELAALLTDNLNKEATLNDLEKQAEIITKYFRSKGYFVASAYIPPQNFQDGAVEIAIEPGRYDEIIINNNTSLHDGAIRRELGSVKSGAVIERSALERAIFLIGDLACAEAKTSLQAGSQPGTTTLTINVDSKGKQDWGYVGFDNSGYKHTGTHRYSAMWGYANFAREGDIFALDAANTTTGGSWSTNASYVIPVLTQGLRFGISYNKSYYALGGPFADLDATGTARTTSAYLEKNLKRTRNANWYAQIRYDHKNLTDEMVGDPAGKSAHNWVFSLRGDTLDAWRGGGFNTYFLTYTRGDLTLYSPDDIEYDQYYRRAGNFGKYNFGATRLQRLNERMDLFLSYLYQYPEKNLDSSEKMSLGGPFGVRAYPVGEASGDQGWISTVELRYNLPRKEDAKNTWQLIAFWDGGSVINDKNPTSLSNGSNRRSLYGAGFGVNWSHVNNYAARIHYAFKLGNEHALSDTDKSGRLWYQLYKFF